MRITVQLLPLLLLILLPLLQWAGHVTSLLGILLSLLLILLVRYMVMSCFVIHVLLFNHQDWMRVP